jgi:hypothetical protein
MVVAELAMVATRFIPLLLSKCNIREQIIILVVIVILVVNR